MEYRAVKNRCAVILDSLHLPIPHDKILEVLSDQGFKRIDVNMIALARQCIGSSRYRRGARSYEAPAVMDCSSFIKWVYAQRGIWLPRRSIQQRELGESVKLNELISGDVVFVSGWIDYYHDNPADGVGHVGLVTGNEMIIHAAGTKTGIIESPLAVFVGRNKFRGARRYVPHNDDVLTFETPPEREVEVASDLRWIVLQSLSR